MAVNTQGNKTRHRRRSNQMAKGRFTAVGAATIGGNGSYFPPNGNFVVEVKQVKVVEARKGQIYYTIECRTLESDVASCPPGTVASCMINMGWEGDSAEKKIKAFLMACMGLDPMHKDSLAAYTPDEWIRCADESAYDGEDHEDSAGNSLKGCTVNPLAGTQLALHTQEIMTKGREGPPHPFTLHLWNPLPSATTA
jgi:hypothetical protein